MYEVKFSVKPLLEILGRLIIGILIIYLYAVYIPEESRFLVNVSAVIILVWILLPYFDFFEKKEVDESSGGNGNDKEI